MASYNYDYENDSESYDFDSIVIELLSSTNVSNQEINIEIPIAETIIIGGVPNTYIEMSNKPPSSI